jgi:DNA-binding NtrC family response regulator
MLLIVDDDRDLRDSLIDFFTIEGHEVYSAGNGREALEWFNGRTTFPGINLSRHRYAGAGRLGLSQGTTWASPDQVNPDCGHVRIAGRCRQGHGRRSSACFA